MMRFPGEQQRIVAANIVAAIVDDSSQRIDAF